jgi:uncharacterized protein YndB with AHSA1/START domain
MSHEETDLQTNRFVSADGTVVITRRMHAPAEVVWAVLADGWMYANWVVGASRVRAVDPQWPRPGTRLHHSFGVWPALVNDHTEVLDWTSGRELMLQARGWPAGQAHVCIQLTPGRTPNSSVVRIAEDVTGGPARLVPRPARQLLVAPRNTEALRRLALIAEGRTTTELTNRDTEHASV